MNQTEPDGTTRSTSGSPYPWGWHFWSLSKCLSFTVWANRFLTVESERFTRDWTSHRSASSLCVTADISECFDYLTFGLVLDWSRRIANLQLG